MPSPRGAISAKGYKSASYQLSVAADKDKQVLPKSWRLDNFASGTGEPKATKDYMTQFEFDLDDDGKVDEKVKEFLYELRYENLSDDGVIWLRTFPISQHDREKKLSVLMKDYIDEASRAGFEVVVFGMRERIVERRYGTKPIREGESHLGKYKAYEATVDVANIDRIKVDPNAVETRARIVLVRPPFQYRFETQYQPGNSKPTPPIDYPVLLLAGYANNPNDFANGEKDFEDFLDRIKIEGASGYDELPLEPAGEGPADTAPADETAPAASGDAEPTPASE